MDTGGGRGVDFTVMEIVKNLYGLRHYIKGRGHSSSAVYYKKDSFLYRRVPRKVAYTVRAVLSMRMMRRDTGFDISLVTKLCNTALLRYFVVQI